MKRSILFTLILFAIILGCNTSKTGNKLVAIDNLLTQQYTIDISHDTTLETKNGALLKIPKGALVSDKGNTVVLDIKEAYSMQQIIEAGLTTQSNGVPLSSGGMIYINAAAGQNVKITKAIKVAVPSDYLIKEMQLFKDEKDEKGNINWKEPTALTENKQLTSIEQGQALFQSKCASCHSIGKDLVGPDLAHFSKRFPFTEENSVYYDHRLPFADKGKKEDTLPRSYINHFYDRYYKWQTYTCNLIRMYGGAVGPILFSDSSNVKGLLNVYKYIQNESDKNNRPLPSHAWLKDGVDSCYKYHQIVDDLQNQKKIAQSNKQKLTKENGGLVKNETAPSPPVINNTAAPTQPVNFDERVSPQYYDSEYYQFTIESFGWFNIDCMIKGEDGVAESELFVRITGQYREKIKVYLIIPSKKIFVEGGPAERNGQEFAFYLKNGKIPLPQDTKGYILAITETEESIAYALKEFTTTLKQEFDILLTQSTKEAFNMAVSGISPDKLKIKAGEAKNADEIRKTNSEIKNIDNELKNAESMKPKRCDCNCGEVDSTGK